MRFLKVPAANAEIEVSRIVLGTTYFGTKIPEDKSYAIIDRYAELGGNTIDTARVYGDWEDNGNAASERVCGNWLRGLGKDRSKFILATKGGHYRIRSRNVSRVNPEDIKTDIELSLENLNTHIDIYFLHRDNPQMPVENIMPVFDEYIRSGDIRAIGASNWKRERIDEANRFCRENGLLPFTVSEIQWSLARLDEANLALAFGGDPTLCGMEAGEYEKYTAGDLPVFCFTSIAWGFFGKYISGKGTMSSESIRKACETPENFRRMEIVRRWSEKTGLSPITLSVAYLTGHRIPAAALVGCSRAEQLDELMAAPDYIPDPEFYHEIAAGS
ncbi:MAG: aldo/keto reductase [Clostridiales bacterium]|nr:aldo/keto reductase [Clostridiales bacterium]